VYWQFLPPLDATAYGCAVGTENEIREFLTSRRAKVTPEVAGLPRYGRYRRVAGLRREEVALLAEISVEYYARLERGNARGVSTDVLEGIAVALRLDDVERRHLLDLVRAANEGLPARRAPAQHVRPSVKRVVDAITGIPAFVGNGRLDILYVNAVAQALYTEHLRDTIKPANSARFAFLNPRAREFYVDWDAVSHDIVAALRIDAGRNPYDRALSDLIGLLSTRSEEFRRLWAKHDVYVHRTGTKTLHHPLVGDMSLSFEMFELPADPGLTLATYTAEPGSESEARLWELAEWGATRERLATASAENTI
jgi:transcriptional regulator with XRE-family HTH domain